MVIHQEQDVEEAVAGFLQAIGPMTTRELADETGIAYESIARTLARMYARRNVEREEIDRKTRLPRKGTCYWRWRWAQ